MMADRESASSRERTPPMMIASLSRAAIDQLRRAAVRATAAHSVYETQPWQLRLDQRGLHVYADPTRQMRVLDPLRRQLFMSVGCALFNARVALAGQGVPALVERLPRTASDLAATVTVGGSGAVDVALADLDAVVES